MVMTQLKDDDTGAYAIPLPESVSLVERVYQALQLNPAFKVLTVDGQEWIDPFTGTRVPAPFGYLEPAREWLLRHQPWKKTQVKSVAELIIFRWRIYVHDWICRERRLRIFSHQGHWLNPFTGAWEIIDAALGPVNTRTARIISDFLAKKHGLEICSLLDRQRLDRAVQRQQATHRHVTTRVTGWRCHTGTIQVESPDLPDPELMEVKQSVESLLRPLPIIPGVGIAVHYEPKVGVGGDFFDCVELDEQRLLLFLGDVTGHGRQGAQIAINCLAELRVLSQEFSDLSTLVFNLNDRLYQKLPKGQFITAFVALVDLPHQRLSSVCIGHHPGLLQRADRTQSILSVGGRAAAFGLVSSTALCEKITMHDIAFGPGDLLFLYTDGLSEARNSFGDEFSDQSIITGLQQHQAKPYDQLMHTIIDSARAHADGELEDDVTAMVVALAPVS